MLPVISPSPLTAMKLPIDHPNWFYELKHDGFRGMLYLDRDRAWFRSRKGNEMGRFGALSQQIRALLKGQRAILDGEIVVLDAGGRSTFADLMMGRGKVSYCAFDLEPGFKSYCTSYGKGLRTTSHLPWIQGSGRIIAGDDLSIYGTDRNSVCSPLQRNAAAYPWPPDNHRPSSLIRHCQRHYHRR